jgi:hypothetical protein
MYFFMNTYNHFNNVNTCFNKQIAYKNTKEH